MVPVFLFFFTFRNTPCNATVFFFFYITHRYKFSTQTPSLIKKTYPVVIFMDLVASFERMLCCEIIQECLVYQLNRLKEF